MFLRQHESNGHFKKDFFHYRVRLSQYNTLKCDSTFCSSGKLNTCGERSDVFWNCKLPIHSTFIFIPFFALFCYKSPSTFPFCRFHKCTPCPTFPGQTLDCQEWEAKLFNIKTFRCIFPVGQCTVNNEKWNRNCYFYILKYLSCFFPVRHLTVAKKSMKDFPFSY